MNDQQQQDRAIECQSVGRPEVGDGLRTVTLAPWGTVESKNGTFIIDAEGVAEILKDFEAQGTSLPIDVEHETLPEFTPASGSRGAIGWIEKVFAEPTRGLLSLVRWSDKGKALIREDAFRYLSPVFLIRKDNRRAVGLHSAAITTLPAIPKMERLAASQHTSMEANAMAAEIVDMGALLGELSGLLKLEVEGDYTAMLVAIRNAIKNLVSKEGQSGAIASSVRAALGVAGDADGPTTLVALSKLSVNAVREEQRTAELRAFLAPYVKKGVIEEDSNWPHQRKDYQEMMALAAFNPEVCKTVLEQRVMSLPHQGGHPDMTVRQTAIGEAVREYSYNPGHQKATSLKAFVAMTLKDKGLPALTEQEAATLRIF